MILVTGGTGFIGQALIRHLVEQGLPVRTLIRPSLQSPDLPYGVSVDVAVSSLSDPRSLRAAMVGIDIVYHLASAERRGSRANLMEIDIQGTRNIIEAARDANVQRIFFVSHLGADRASAYPLLKTKAIAEEFIRQSEIKFTILRSAIVFGPHDGFTTGLARLISAIPFFVLVPGDAKTILQPLWVEDLVTCLTWSLDDPETVNRTIDIGGPEYLTFDEIVSLIMQESRFYRRLVHLSPVYLRWLSIFLESLFPGLPVSTFWLDYLAVNRTTALDTLPRIFHLLPSRMAQRLMYLRNVNWRRELKHSLIKRVE
jgi:uncharacterized protein YbjT (DUF2867 family)